MVLPSCKKINEAIDGLDNRLDALENETIPTIDEQIAAINLSLDALEATDKELKGYIERLTKTAENLQKQIDATNTKIDEVKTALQGEISTAKADVLAQLEAVKTELEGELAQINATIETLKEKDKELDQKIADLRSYVDTELGKTTDWVNATFATLEQYNALVAEVTTIKAQIVAINQSIADLETRLTTKINEDIATAVSTLNADIQQKVKEITDGYTEAVKNAKEEITTAYKAAIATAISNLEASLKSWVGEQLSNYYTIAEVDTLLATLTQEMNGKLEAQKTYLEGLISELSEQLTKNIADNKELIDALREDLSSAQGEIAANKLAIADNSEQISKNAAKITANAQTIAENSADIEGNSQKIDENKSLIKANETLINSNKSAITSLQTNIDTATKAIAKNAEDIAKNAALISANATAIGNNAQAIADNATEIANLKTSLETTKSEITEAYKKAIEEAISTNNGVIDTKIANEVATINTRINNEVAAINATIKALTERIKSIESEISSIKQQIANILSDIADMKEDITKLLSRIQSVSYIPKYSDGKATVLYSDEASQVTLDFEISPKDAVIELAKVWQSALNLKAVYTETRAMPFVDMPITEFEADTQNGVISVTASGENLSAPFFADMQEASVRLAISDGNSSVMSEYIPMVAEGLHINKVSLLYPQIETWFDDYSTSSCQLESSAIHIGAIDVVGAPAETIASIGVVINGVFYELATQCTSTPPTTILTDFPSGKYTIEPYAKVAINGSLYELYGEVTTKTVTSIPTILYDVYSSYSHNDKKVMRNDISGNEIRVKASLSDMYVQENLVQEATFTFGNSNASVTLGPERSYVASNGAYNTFIKIILKNGYTLTSNNHTIHVTGIPFTMTTASNIDNCITNGGAEWGTDGGVRLDHKSSGEYYISKTFYAPIDIAISIENNGTIKNGLIGECSYNLMVAGSCVYSVVGQSTAAQTWGTINTTTISPKNSTIQMRATTHSPGLDYVTIKSLIIGYLE